MFTVVESFEMLPTDVNDGVFYFCSLENKVYVYNNSMWVSYEDFVGGFEQIASVVMTTDFITSDEAFVLENAPFFEDYKQNYLYPVVFSANKLVAADDGVFNFNIVSDTGFELLSCSTKEIFYPTFSCYYFVNQEISSNEPTKTLTNLNDRLYPAGFNLSVSNIVIKAPIVLTLFKPVGV